jgi:hypothetical protein
MLSPAPPPDVSRIDLAKNQEEFILTDSNSGKRALVKRIDFFSWKLASPLPFGAHILAFAFNTTDEAEARKIIRKKLGEVKEIAIFLFKYIESIE